MIKVAEIRSADGVTREKIRWKRRKRLGGILENCSSGMAVTMDKIITKTIRLHNFIRATFTVLDFSNCARRSISVDLNSSDDNIVNGVGNRKLGFIFSFTMNGTALINQKTEDLLRELCNRRRKEHRVELLLFCIIKE